MMDIYEKNKKGKNRYYLACEKCKNQKTIDCYKEDLEQNIVCVECENNRMIITDFLDDVDIYSDVF